MLYVKAKDKDDWSVWHYGIYDSPTTLRSNSCSIPIVPRTLCKSTGLKCKGQTVYENDWIQVYGDGEYHKFLVQCAKVNHRDYFSAFADETTSYNLANMLADETCKVVGNLYD